ncbi:MAG: hypothetical protein GC192_05965 [Bacteroidetes bacterium]|nr:hypothetical protein [Bacteroidota bacterium]
MTAKTDLFDLIKRLKKAEKRYFTITYQSQEGTKSYMTLFQEIDKMEVYDENALKNSLEKLDFNVENLAVTKVNLTKAILRSLRLFYESNSPEHKILSMLLEAEIVRKKGLYKLAIKLLEKAKAHAVFYEMHFHIFEILNRLVFIHIDLYGNVVKTRLEELFNEIEELQIKTEKQARLQAITYRTMLISFSKSSKDPTFKAEIAGIESQIKFFQIENDDTFFSKHFYFFTYGTLTRIRGELAASNKYFEKILELWDRHPHIRNINARIYKSYVTTYLNSCHLLEKYSVFDEWLEKFENIPDTNFDEEAGSFKDFYHITLLYLLNTHQFERALELVPKIEAGLEIYRAKVNKSREMTLRYNVFILFFLCEKFSEALDWLATLKLDNKIEAKADNRSFARIMRVIVHYELGHNRILENLRTSVYRKLKKQAQLHEFERIILDHIRLLEQAVNEKAKKLLFEELYGKLNSLGEKLGINNVSGLEEIICWAESRLKKIPYLKAIEAKKKH